MILLRQSTNSQEIPLGYFLDSTDGNTEETGLTIANTDIKLWKAGATSLASKNSGGATHISNGIYYAVLDSTDTDTVGSLVVFVHVSGALAVRLECLVLPQQVYDSLVAGTDYLQADTVQIGGTTQTARDIGASVLLSSGTGTGQILLSSGQVSVGTNNDKTGYALTSAYDAAKTAASQTSVDTINGLVDDLETRLTATRAGYLDNLVNLDATVSSRLASASYTAPDNSSITAIKTQTDKLAFSGAGPYDVKATLDGETVVVSTNNDKTGYSLTSAYDAAKTASSQTSVDTIGTNVSAIKAKTDNLPSDPADQSLVEAAISSAVAPLATASELAKVPKSDGTATWNSTALTSIQSKVADALNAYDPPTKSEMDTAIDGLPTASEIRSEMDSNSTKLAAILEDTGTTLDAKIDAIDGVVDLVEDILRNKMTINDSSGNLVLYQDDNVTPLFSVSSAVTDDSTTTTRKRLE